MFCSSVQTVYISDAEMRAAFHNPQHKIPGRTLFLFSQFVELHSASISAWLNHCIALTYALQLKMNECKIIYIQRL